MAGRAAHPAGSGSQAGPAPDGPLPSGLDAHPDLTWLWSVVSGLASVASPWEEGGAEQETLIWTSVYEVVLQRWPAGRPGRLHDHGLSHAAICVVDGVVQEVVADGEATEAHRRGPGEGSVLPAGTLHRITNAGPGPATTVNVYAPPLHEVGPAAAGAGELLPRRAGKADGQVDDR